MVTLSEVRANNTALKTLGPGLVAVFVGGTSGIGLSTAREFIRNTQNPRVYLVGRNEAEASRIIPELKAINETSNVEFIKSDVSLLKNVDQVCKDIQAKESKVNLLFMTMGYFTMSGRDETVEGLDRKFSLHYYARARFTQNLLPLLAAAANDPDPQRNLSRVVSVLDPQPGRKFAPNFGDLDLKNNFSLKNCAIHATAMNSFSHEHFANIQPETSFIHAFPSVVLTNVQRELGGFAKSLWGVIGATVLKPFSVNIKESGERHVFAATTPKFAPKGKVESVEGLAKGSDEIVGSGAYAVSWDGEVFGESKKAASLRREGAVDKIWKHTDQVFRKILDKGKN